MGYTRVGARRYIHKRDLPVNACLRTICASSENVGWSPTYTRAGVRLPQSEFEQTVAASELEQTVAAERRESISRLLLQANSSIVHSQVRSMNHLSCTSRVFTLYFPTVISVSV